MATWRRVLPFSPPAPARRGTLFGAVALLLGISIALLVWQPWRTPAPASVGGPRIILSSRPFPMSVGNNTLSIQLVGPDGAALEAESVRFDAIGLHPGAMPLSRTVTAADDGRYSAMLTFAMMGEFTVDITATLTSGETVQEHYDVFVYPVVPANSNPRTTYVSASELAAIPYDETKELRITIPQGTRAGIVGGHGDDVIGEEIRLSVSGRNTLIIQNNDIADHSVGPFFVKAGETLRQEFRTPAAYQGACSIRHGAEVNIIVDA